MRDGARLELAGRSHTPSNRACLPIPPHSADWPSEAKAPSAGSQYTDRRAPPPEGSAEVFTDYSPQPAKIPPDAHRQRGLIATAAKSPCASCALVVKLEIRRRWPCTARSIATPLHVPAGPMNVCIGEAPKQQELPQPFPNIIAAGAFPAAPMPFHPTTASWLKRSLREICNRLTASPSCWGPVCRSDPRHGRPKATAKDHPCNGSVVPTITVVTACFKDPQPMPPHCLEGHGATQ